MVKNCINNRAETTPDTIYLFVDKRVIIEK